MNILFTVCGRAGSKGIRGKNIRDFLKFPLPYYTLASIALYVKTNTEDTIDVVINSDSEPLLSMAQTNPFLTVHTVRRDESLGGDLVPKPAVINNSLSVMTERMGYTYDMVVDLDITSPLRRVIDIQNLVNTQKETRADVTFSVTDSRRNPYFNMVAQKNGWYKQVCDSDFVTRQQAPQIFDMNASMYAYDPAFLKTESRVLDGRCAIIKMVDTGVLDLDHEGEFELMEVIAKHFYDTDLQFGEIYTTVVKQCQ